eukprot:6837162-Prymnesium_polylepis.2
MYSAHRNVRLGCTYWYTISWSPSKGSRRRGALKSDAVSTVPAGSSALAVCVTMESSDGLRKSSMFGATSVRHPASVAEIDWPGPSAERSTMLKSLLYVMGSAA